MIEANLKDKLCKLHKECVAKQHNSQLLDNVSKILVHIANYAIDLPVPDILACISWHKSTPLTV